MLKAFQKHIESNSLFNKEDKILLAISGGVDSMLMLHLFESAGYSFAVAHCNFSLRGAQSDADENFVKEYCAQKNEDFHSIRFDTYSISKQNKESIEETARNLRYNWFNEIASSLNCKYIATAHHQNDVSETLLFNLSRGTGLAGLHGILPKRHNIIRPLLFANKKEIEAYAHSHHIPFVNDITNTQTIYSRNKIRHELIPLFNKLNPDFINSSNRLSQIMRETEDLLGYFIEDVKKKAITHIDNYTCLDFGLIDKKIINQTLIFELIKPYGFNSSQCYDIFESLGKSGLIFHSKEFDLVIDRKKLLIKSKSNTERENISITIDSLPCEIKIHGRKFVLELVNSDSINLEELKAKKVQCINFDSLKLPLIARQPSPGERFSPYGLKGSKKISDYLIDKKINVIDKTHLVGIYKEEIIALLGLEIDNKFAIKNTTKQILSVKQIS